MSLCPLQTDKTEGICPSCIVSSGASLNTLLLRLYPEGQALLFAHLFAQPLDYCSLVWNL